MATALQSRLKTFETAATAPVFEVVIELLGFFRLKTFETAATAPACQ